MKISVDLEACERHGQCIIAAPDVFWWDNDDELAWVEAPPDAAYEDAVDAADVCPVQAIRVEAGGDPTGRGLMREHR